MGELNWEEQCAAWQAAGIPCLASVNVEDADEAAAVQARWGGTVWVRGAEDAPVVICASVKNPADLPLAVMQARKHSGRDRLVVQRPGAGPKFRVTGFRQGRVFRPAEILRETVTRGMYRVVMARSTPPELKGGDYMRMLDLCAAATRLLPGSGGPLAFSFIASGAGPVIAWIDTRSAVEAGDQLLLQHALGIDLAAACEAARRGARSALCATRGMGAALAYMPTHGGIVTEVTGVEAARALPGVVTLEVFARRGDTLGHVIDTVSRNAGGYVLATGATAAIARSRVEAALAAIEIHVESVRR